MRRNRRMRRPRAMNIMRRRMRITEEIERGRVKIGRERNERIRI